MSAATEIKEMKRAKNLFSKSVLPVDPVPLLFDKALEKPSITLRMHGVAAAGRVRSDLQI